MGWTRGQAHCQRTQMEKMLWLTLGLLGMLGWCTVTAETDPLVLQLLTRMEAQGKLGIQQQQRIQQLELEIQQLKGLDPPTVADLGTDNGVTAGVTYGPDRETEGKKESKTEMAGTFSKRFVLDTEEACFHATLDDALHDHIHLSQILAFNKVKLNLGDAYNNKTGIFVTPINGIYVFSLSVRAMTDNTHFDIMKNGEEVGAVFAHSGDQGSITIAQFLNVGDTVHVEVVRHDDVAVWGDKLTSFMGCLITPY